MKMLIVDDSHIVRMTIEKYAREMGITDIIKASNGSLGVKEFEANRPSLVTLDITMPEMDGLACLDEIMKIDNSAKVLVITALKDKATGLSAIKKGARAFLPKPFTGEQLKEELSIVLGGRP